MGGKEKNCLRVSNFHREGMEASVRASADMGCRYPWEDSEITEARPEEWGSKIVSRICFRAKLAGSADAFQR